MKIGILGTGDVGQALGKAFVALGSDVKMGSREPRNAKALAWAETVGAKATVGTFADAAGFGDLVVLATLGTATPQVIDSAGVGRFRGKVVIDSTNPLDFSTGKARLAVGHTDSLGEQIQRQIKDAGVVKAFNTVGSLHMFRPSFAGGPPDMLICGNDVSAKRTVTSILGDFGWGTVDLGGIESSRYLEPICMAWVTYGMLNNSWNHAFKLLRR